MDYQIATAEISDYNAEFSMLRGDELSDYYKFLEFLEECRGPAQPEGSARKLRDPRLDLEGIEGRLVDVRDREFELHRALGDLLRHPGHQPVTFVERIERLCQTAGMPAKLSALGVTASQLDWLAENSGGASMRGNPVQLDAGELRSALLAIL